MQYEIKYICICFAGPRDHPDIAEAFMHLHAQVSQTDRDVHEAMTKLSLGPVCFSTGS